VASRPYAPLDGVVAVVDAERMAAPDTAILPLARRQVTCAGLVLLNKVDLDPGEDAARSWVRSVSGTVPIIATQQASVPLHALFGIGLRDGGAGDGTADGAAIPSFESTTFRSQTPVSIRRLHALLGGLPRGLVRVKGILNLVEKPEQRCLLQVSGGQASVTVDRPWRDKEAETRLVFIGVSGSVDPQGIARYLHP
jgi:G3E family GTPase